MAESLNATFFAFRKREKGGVLLGATIAFGVIALVLIGGFFLINAQGITEYFRWVMSMGGMMAGGKPGAAPTDMMMPPASVMALIPTYFLFMLFYYVLFAAYEAACLRWMVRGETEGLFGLSLGADTWRVYFGYWIWFFLLIAFYIVCLMLFGGVFISMMAAGQGGDTGGMGPMAAILPLLGLVICVGVIYLAVRLAPAAATSIARKRFAFFDAWKVTSGRFWALFGAFVLLFVMYLVGVMILSTAMGAAIGVNVAGQLGGGAQPSSAEEAFRAFATPQMLVTVGLAYAVIIAVALTWLVALFGVNARAAQAALEEGKIERAA